MSTHLEIIESLLAIQNKIISKKVSGIAEDIKALIIDAAELVEMAPVLDSRLKKLSEESDTLIARIGAGKRINKKKTLSALAEVWAMVGLVLSREEIDFAAYNRCHDETTSLLSPVLPFDSTARLLFVLAWLRRAEHRLMLIDLGLRPASHRFDLRDLEQEAIYAFEQAWAVTRDFSVDGRNSFESFELAEGWTKYGNLLLDLRTQDAWLQAVQSYEKALCLLKGGASSFWNEKTVLLRLEAMIGRARVLAFMASEAQAVESLWAVVDDFDEATDLSLKVIDVVFRDNPHPRLDIWKDFQNLFQLAFKIRANVLIIIGTQESLKRAVESYRKAIQEVHLKTFDSYSPGESESSVLRLLVGLYEWLVDLYEHLGNTWVYRENEDSDPLV